MIGQSLKEGLKAFDKKSIPNQLLDSHKQTKAENFKFKVI